MYRRVYSALTCSGTKSSASLLGQKEHTSSTLMQSPSFKKGRWTASSRHFKRLFLNAFYLALRVHIPFASSFSRTTHSRCTAVCSNTAWQRCAGLCFWVNRSVLTELQLKRFTEQCEMISLIIVAEKQHKSSRTNSTCSAQTSEHIQSN